jgi:hypothetical protein
MQQRHGWTTPRVDPLADPDRISGRPPLPNRPLQR